MTPAGSLRSPTQAGSLRFALACFALLLVSFGASGCGGSSSETPFPLPPHPLHEPYRTKRVASAAPVEQDEEETEEEAAEFEVREPAPTRPARSTWGGGKESPRPATDLK